MATDQPPAELSVFGLLMTVAIEMCYRVMSSATKLNTYALKGG